MNKKSNYKIILCSILIIVLGIFLYAIYFIHHGANESAQRALVKEAIKLLDEYYQYHDKYPVVLSELKFTFPDGGDPSLLDDIEYRTDGKSYELKTVGYSTKQLIEIQKTEQQHLQGTGDKTPPVL